MIDGRSPFLLFSCAISKGAIRWNCMALKGIKHTKDHLFQFHILADIHVFVVTIVWNWQTSVEMSSQRKFFASFNSKMKAC